MKFLLDPKIFNYIIMSLYALSAVRWAQHRSWADTAYWIGALWLTIVVTFFYKR